MTLRVRLVSFCSVLLAFATTSTAYAQTDRLFPVDGQMVIGQIKEITKNGVAMTVSGKEQTFQPADIERIVFQTEPQALTQAREFVVDGQYEQAFEELKNVDIDGISREAVQAETAFYRMWSQGKLALSGKGELNAAASAALSYARNYANSWRFFDTAKMLGDLAAATGNYEQAIRYYGSLRSAPATETKMESVYLTGTAQLAKEDYAAAEKAFAQIRGLRQVSSIEALRLKNLATAGLANAKAKSGSPEEALELLQSLIEQLDPAETRLAAQVYNAQGAAYEAMGDDEGAILAYLHTHLMFSGDSASHVQALKRLTELWTKVGKPDRAAQTRGELRQRYPGLSS